MSKAVIGFLIIVTLGITIAGIINYKNFAEPTSSDDPTEELSPYNRNKNNRLKVFSPFDINPSLVDSSLRKKRSDHVITDFSFINQLGDTVTKATTANKITVIDFFFTTCGGICPKMTTQLQRVHREFLNDPNFLILSHTVNPKKDSVPVMYAYAERFEADHEKWWFLTGSKEELYKMARKSYLIVPDQDDPNFEHGNESDFIHTENFALVDPDGRIRGMYDGTNASEVSELMRDVYDLKKEYGFDD